MNIRPIKSLNIKDFTCACRDCFFTDYDAEVTESGNYFDTETVTVPEVPTFDLEGSEEPF